MKNIYIKGQALDLLEASYLRCQNPIIYCDIYFQSKIDIESIKKAITLTTLSIPEILYAYDLNKNTWFENGYNVDDIIVNKKTVNYQWDLTKGPQLKMFFSNDKSHIKIGISHILTDGTGFKEYLYLLCKAYNFNNNFSILKNNRNADSILKIISNKRLKKYITQKDKNINIGFNDTGNELYSINCFINQKDFIKIKEKAHVLKVTINDMIIDCYAKALYDITKQNDFTIACPVNLRQYINDNSIRICNLTGIFNCKIKIDENSTNLLEQIHFEMQRQKERNEYFYKLRLLHKAYTKVPLFLLKKILLKFYLIPPVSYTNIGIIDEKQLVFNDCKIKTCYITNSYRKTPRFQMAVSTYNNVFHLSSNIIGSKNNYKITKKILELTKKYLLLYIE